MITRKNVPRSGRRSRGIIQGEGCYPDEPRGIPRRPVKELAAPAHGLVDLPLVRVFSQEIFRPGSKAVIRHFAAREMEMIGNEIWPFLFFLGLLFLNWPFLDLFKPYLPYYLFFVWGLFILIVGLLISHVAGKKRRDDV